jgi:TIR domain-containing protein
MAEERKLRVFLSYTHADFKPVRKLYEDLNEQGFDVWFDEESLIPGQDWRTEIEKGLNSSDAVIICLSPESVNKEGFIQKEFKFALEKALEMPEGKIFLIPARVEECDVPQTFNKYQWVDLFRTNGFARLMKALELRRNQISIPTLSNSNLKSRSSVELEYPCVQRPYNLSFDGPTTKDVPVGWFNSLFYVDNVSIDYEISVVKRDDNEGICTLLKNLNATKNQFGSLMQRCLADFLAGKMIRLEAEVKTKDIKDWSGVWLRADHFDGHSLFFDNMHRRPICGTTGWKKYQIEAQIPKQTTWLNYGIVLSGSGMMWADNFQILVWENNSWKEV